MKRSTITRDLHSPKYRQRIVADKPKQADKLACRNAIELCRPDEDDFDRYIAGDRS